MKFSKILSILLVLMLTLSVFAVNTSAYSGSGTSSSPYLISSYADLRQLSYDVAAGNTYSGKYFKVASDINCNFAAFTPIGKESAPFSGTFDGNGKKIENLNVTRFDYAGLFGYLKGATVKDIFLTGTTTASGMQDLTAGAIASTAVNSTVKGCITRVTVTARLSEFSVSEGKNILAGGIVAKAHNTLISDCSIQSTVNATYASDGSDLVQYSVAGGAVGAALEGTRIRNTFNAGIVNASGSYSATYAYCGGLAGYVDASSSVENSYNSYSVQSRSCHRAYLGGLVGYCDGKITNSYAKEVPTVITTGVYVGYITAEKGEGATVSNCYFRVMGIPVGISGIGENCGYFTYQNSTVKPASGSLKINGKNYTEISLEKALNEGRSGKSGYAAWVTYDGLNEDCPVFESATTTVTGKANLGGTIDPDGAERIYKGSTVTVTPKPDEGYNQGKVLVNGVETELISDRITLTDVLSPVTVETYFTPKDYKVVASAGKGGTISPYGVKQVKYGDSASYTIKADSGYVIDYVEVNGENVGAVSSYTFDKIAQSCTITAFFKSTTGGATPIDPDVTPDTPDNSGNSGSKPDNSGNNSSGNHGGGDHGGGPNAPTAPTDPDTPIETDENGNTVGGLVTDEYGNIITDIVTDENGNYVTDENGGDPEETTYSLPPINTEGKSKWPIVIFIGACVLLIGGGLLTAYLISKSKEKNS